MFSFLGKNHVKNIAVVDFSSTSVGAAYATVSGVAPPEVVFSVRIPSGEYGAGNAGALRALDMVAKDMMNKGAPLLRKVTGSGSVEATFVLIGSPWQKDILSTKTIEKDKPFIFTKTLLEEGTPKEGRVAIVGTVLNGYETTEPIGKKVKRAEIAMLSASLDPEIERLSKRAIRSFVGAAPLSFVSFAEAAPHVLKKYFPHERDFLAIRVLDATTDIAFIKQAHLAGVETALQGTGAFHAAAKTKGFSKGAAVDGIIDKEKSGALSKRMEEASSAWIAAMREAFLKVAAEGALPRTLFLFADEGALPLFKNLLDAPELHTLWLSDEPLSVIPMNKGSLGASMRRLDARTESDAVLDLLCHLA